MKILKRKKDNNVKWFKILDIKIVQNIICEIKAKIVDYDVNGKEKMKIENEIMKFYIDLGNIFKMLNTKNEIEKIFAKHNISDKQFEKQLKEYLKENYNLIAKYEIKWNEKEQCNVMKFNNKKCKLITKVFV